MLEAYYGLLSSFDGDPARQDRQMRLCLEALEVYPLDAQLLCAMGSYLQFQNRFDLAVRTFETAARYGKVDPTAWHLCEIADMAAAFLALTLQIEGRDDEARRVLEEGLSASENSVRLRRHLIDLLVKRGETDEAIRQSQSIDVEPAQRKPLENAIRGACRAAGQDWLAALGFLQSAYAEGCRHPLCLRWLAVTLLSAGRPEAAEPVLHEWLQSEPTSAEVQSYLRTLKQFDALQRAPKSAKRFPADGGRRLRIDPGTTVTQVTPLGMPIVHQASSTDVTCDEAP
jgi:tetratricopeptide (TPR) repeat protein